MELRTLQSQTNSDSLKLQSIEVPQDAFILSDFDHTLCHTFTFDARSNDHMPSIHPSTIEASRNKHLIIATGRRAESAAIKHMWTSGLIPFDRPVIAENGGVMVYNRDNSLRYENLAPESTTGYLEDVVKKLESDAPAPNGDKKLVIKIGRTMLITRVQDANGATTPDDQAWLLDKVNQSLPSPELVAVDNRVSIGVLHKDVNKVAAFMYYLTQTGTKREDIFVVGMGDGENDREILQESNLSIGFGEVVRKYVDICLPGTDEAVSEALQKISPTN
jgi:hydroxymethylpyrimidine pyrophosphatase-like HAD family hydrolase